MINEQLSTNYDNFNKVFQGVYTNLIDEFEDTMSLILKTGFKMSEDDVYKKLCKLETEMLNYTIFEFRNVFKTSSNQSLILQFNKFFYKDDNEQPRHWPSLEEGNIKDAHKVASTKALALLDQLQLTTLPQNLTVYQTRADLESKATLAVDEQKRSKVNRTCTPSDPVLTP